MLMQQMLEPTAARRMLRQTPLREMSTMKTEVIVTDQLGPEPRRVASSGFVASGRRVGSRTNFGGLHVGDSTPAGRVRDTRSVELR